VSAARESEPGYSTATWVIFSGAELAAEFGELETRLAAGSISEVDVAAVRARLDHTITARCRSGTGARRLRALARRSLATRHGS
jgi:hypothetical protein